MSNISLDFDPHSDRLILHSLQVRRAGRVIDQLRKARITVLQRERGLEDGLLDGTLTLTAVLEDLRPGDIVAYSFSVHSNDPILGNRYNDSFTAQWSTPVRWSRLRLLQPEDRVIHIDQIGADLKPVIRHDGATKETIWQWRDLAGLRNESEQPSWHMHYPRIRLSEWDSWQDVVEWGVPLYELRPLSAPMQALVDQWRKEAADDPSRIVAALRFVQDKVRYTGIEIGPGAYQPTDPARVLERRYGDCKDKALLLVTLLHAMKINAQPALVNTWLEHEIENVLPGPRMFDHVIVRIRSGGRTYWFDATETLQGGTLQTANQAHFGAALVIAPGVQKLEPMPDAVLAQPTTDITESFDLAAGTKAQGTMQVKSIYRAADADSTRRWLQASTSAADHPQVSRLLPRLVSGHQIVGAAADQGRARCEPHRDRRALHDRAGVRREGRRRAALRNQSGRGRSAREGAEAGGALLAAVRQPSAQRALPGDGSAAQGLEHRQ